MPSIGNVLEFVDLLQVKPLGGRDLNCVLVRNKNSKCRKCADACIKDAITIGFSDVSIDCEQCVNCGCCIAVCPGDALFALSPTIQEAVDKACTVADRKSGMTVIACARKAAKQEGDPAKYAEVPCLGHVSESLLFEIAARGIDDIVLVDGDCETCVYGKVSPFIDKAVDTATRLTEAVDGQVVVTRTSEFPPEVIDRAKASLRGKDRRGLIRQTGSYVKAVAGNVAEKALNENAGKEDTAFTVNLKLPQIKGGKLAKMEPAQNYRLLDAMDILSSNLDSVISQGNMIETRHFGDVSIDAEECSGCGICTLACPTGALKFSELEEHSDENMRYIEFQASDCIQCNLCSEACLRDAIQVSGKDSIKSLYDFEPKLIGIKRPQRDNILADFKRRMNRK